MNIGILTYHFGTNFGGQLQCYALMRTLENLGHKVCVVNYVPSVSRVSLLSDIKQGLRHIKKNGISYYIKEMSFYQNNI